MAGSGPAARAAAGASSFIAAWPVLGLWASVAGHRLWSLRGRPLTDVKSPRWTEAEVWSPSSSPLRLTPGGARLPWETHRLLPLHFLVLFPRVGPPGWPVTVQLVLPPHKEKTEGHFSVEFETQTTLLTHMLPAWFPSVLIRPLVTPLGSPQARCALILKCCRSFKKPGV